MWFLGNQVLTCRKWLSCMASSPFLQYSPGSSPSTADKSGSRSYPVPWHNVPLLWSFSPYMARAARNDFDDAKALSTDQTTSLLSSCLNSCVQGPMLLAIAGL